jgi:quercetin dioxygenase-like cupin family protein
VSLWLAKYIQHLGILHYRKPDEQLLNNDRNSAVGWLPKYPRKGKMKQSEVEVHKWSGSETPDESALRQILAEEGLHAYRWSNAPGDVYGAHTHPFSKVIYVVSGSITFGLPDSGDQVTLNTGDRLNLPTGVSHNAVVGTQGVVCLEAHR